ncbi:hypothetical protein [Variovorax sp. KK3]|uniref:hypothetical protein n=1 Tax=Variovorax sp. KK3 TaxID=1855728 RepID=UPI00097C6DF3|nr:hypothetical protein [Variovorax sp. KK3]
MAAHLLQLLMAAGASLTAAVAFGALVGPAQVGARILEFSVLRKIHPLLSARLAGFWTLCIPGASMAAARTTGDTYATRLQRRIAAAFFNAFDGFRDWRFWARRSRSGVSVAVANAIYNATGVRVRDYPVTLDKLIERIPSLADN